MRYFIVFEDLGGGALAKKMAGYHQFHAVNVAVEETLRAAAGDQQLSEAPGTYEAGQRPGGDPGDRRVGVVWHTQGSGKSLTMAFYAGRIILRRLEETGPGRLVMGRHLLHCAQLTRLVPMSSVRASSGPSASSGRPVRRFGSTRTC